MTCIVGLKKNGKVYLGGDSASVGGYDLMVTREPKVFKNGEALIGYTSSWRMGQLLRYKLVLPHQPVEMDDDTYLRTMFVDAVRQTLKDGGYTKVENNVEIGGLFLVGYRGRLFRVDEDFQVLEPVADFDAVGCGEAYAKGALYASQDVKDETKRVMQALEAAERMSAGVRGPFVVIAGAEQARTGKKA